MTVATSQQVRIRTYCTEDRDAVLCLYRDGVVDGHVNANAQTPDLLDVPSHYLSSCNNHFWVAELDDGLVGMIGVAAVPTRHIARIRRLRVGPAFHNNIALGDQLLETAMAHCKRHGFLKVLVDTHFRDDHALFVLSRFGFQYTRRKRGDSHDVLEFYANLYYTPEDELFGLCH